MRGKSIAAGAMPRSSCHHVRMRCRARRPRMRPLPVTLQELALRRIVNVGEFVTTGPTLPAAAAAPRLHRSRVGGLGWRLRRRST